MLTHAFIFFWLLSLLSFFDTFEWDIILLLRRMLSRFSEHLGVVIGSGRNMWCRRDLGRFLVVHGRCRVCHFMVHNRCRCNHRLVVYHCRCYRKTIGNWHDGRMYAVGIWVHAVGNRHHRRVDSLTFGTLLVSILLIGMRSRMVKWVQLRVLEGVAVGEIWMMGVRLWVVE